MRDRTLVEILHRLDCFSATEFADSGALVGEREFIRTFGVNQCAQSPVTRLDFLLVGSFWSEISAFIRVLFKVKQLGWISRVADLFKLFSTNHEHARNRTAIVIL